MQISFDVETTYHSGNLPWQLEARIICLSAARSDGVVKSWVLDHPESTQTPRECIDEIKEFFSTARTLIAHNLKFDLHWLRHIGIAPDGHRLYCTMVAEYTISGQQTKKELALAPLSKAYGIADKIDKVKLYWESGYETDEIPVRILVPYCEQDAINALAIYLQQVPQIKELGMETLVSLEMEALRIFNDMEWNGMLLDGEKLSTYSKEYGERLQEMDEELASLLDVDNPGSSTQLSPALFGGTYTIDSTEEVERILKGGRVKRYTRKCKADRTLEGLGFKPRDDWKLKKEGLYQTTIDVLKSLTCRNKKQRRVKELLLERSRIAQLKGTYFDGLKDHIQEDGRVHPSINQALTATGRGSCSKPNLQNQPRGNTGPVKECFITRFRE